MAERKPTGPSGRKKTPSKGTPTVKKAAPKAGAKKTPARSRAKTPAVPDPPDPPSSAEAGDTPPPDLRGTATQELLHGLAVGLTRVAAGAERAKHGLQILANRGAEEAKKTTRAAETQAAKAAERAKALAAEAGEKAKMAALQGGAVVAGVAVAAGYSARQAVQRVGASAEEVVAAARGVSAGILLKAEEKADVAAGNLQAMSAELANRARAARSAGVDFYERHREEIIALLITAAKIAAVIGVRRLAGVGGPGAGKVSKRVADAAAILTAVVGQVGTLLARQPSALPILKELFDKGDEPEQAVVGMLLGPALSSDPDHAVDVIREFLEGASSEAAADTIARRTLAPLLEDNPRLVDKVTPWLRAAAPLVQRGALLALARVIGDRKSRLGDVLAAAVVVLEDHDEEVRQGLDWLLRAASDVDLDATARAVLGWMRRDKGREDVVDRLPGPLARRVVALRDEEA